MTDKTTRLLLLLLAGLILGFLICFFVPMPYVDAQGVGIFTTAATGTRTNCSQLTSPITGQTWCLDGASQQIMVWNGTAYSTVTLGNTQPFVYTIGAQTNMINDYFLYTATGTQQQVGLMLDMVATNTESSTGFFRIPFVVRCQTGGGTGADGCEGMNAIVQQNAADDVAFLSGLEIAVNNLKRNDPLNPIDRNHYGVTIDTYGGFSTGPAAIAIRSGQANSTWQRGIWIPASTISPNGYAFDYEGNQTDGAVRITNGAVLQVASGVWFNATQILFNGQFAAQTPRCTNNCGTNPSVVGTNTAMRVTMGATGTPRSPFLVLFNGAWNATPSCIAQLTTATTTTVSVTNASTTGITVNTVIGPAQGDVYAIHCLGAG
jgi:hypothetical protein